MTSFIEDFDKAVKDIEGVSTSSAPPTYWYHSGNYVLNYIISGSFFRGIPQGRITDLAGPSGSGKSFLAMNFCREAQRGIDPAVALGLQPVSGTRPLEGAHVLVIDTENALDDDFVSKIGVDPEERYTYRGVSTINQAVKIISLYLKSYKAKFPDLSKAPEVFILLDSLDMMITETEQEHYDKGNQKGDQGQKNKQLKHMLRTLVQDIKALNVTMLVTSQVYKNQDVTNGEGVWIVADAVRYSASQILLLTKLKLKDDKDVKAGTVGIRMKVEGNKTRFTKPFQTVTVEVPYDSGMDPYSGLIEVAVALGIVAKAGSRYVVVGEEVTWFAKDIADHAARILEKAEAMTNKFLDADVAPEEEVTETETKNQIRQRQFDAVQGKAGK